MEMTMNIGAFTALGQNEMMAIEGGDVVEEVVKAVSGMLDSWAGWWYDAGRHTYNWLNS